MLRWVHGDCVYLCPHSSLRGYNKLFCVSIIWSGTISAIMSGGRMMYALCCCEYPVLHSPLRWLVYCRQSCSRWRRKEVSKKRLNMYFHVTRTLNLCRPNQSRYSFNFCPLGCFLYSISSSSPTSECPDAPFLPLSFSFSLDLSFLVSSCQY